jgi:hypothetical protein
VTAVPHNRGRDRDRQNRGQDQDRSRRQVLVTGLAASALLATAAVSDRFPEMVFAR